MGRRLPVRGERRGRCDRGSVYNVGNDDLIRANGCLSPSLIQARSITLSGDEPGGAGTGLRSP